MGLVMGEGGIEFSDKSPSKGVELFAKRHAIWDEFHRCLGRSSGSFVSNEFGDGGVCFMTNRSDDRNLAFVDGSGNDGLVECPEVFETAAASCEDDRVDTQALVFGRDLIDRVGDLTFGVVALALALAPFGVVALALIP